MGLLDLEQQLAFYRAYHFNKVNVAIHLVFVPTILFSTVGFLSAIPLNQITPFDLSGVPFFGKLYNLGAFLIASFSIYYILLDRLGLVLTPLLLLISYSISTLYDFYDKSEVVKGSLVLFGIGWAVQFVGHALFERRAPALFDNLVQALVLAPYFVAFEVVFALGFRKDLQKKMNNHAGKLMLEFRTREKGHPVVEKTD
ncbi:Phytosphingosine metabolism [Komagataella phaffii CBS 7435]|uniref:Uncharacterized protein n=2 Tax=Komagataella phaffii TaxID=460519 RepID=C4R0G2_KOMPG|nr:uncharacterized protein PAS_chr2-1_0365 [Komagataella phaffii GS115]AOA62038.1 GQ67_00404T0 [Komagataella phaffii]CAH2448497.1 Phytosphingosine metabolism [Komagataella phaffii CBS 7435]AOA67730.1 GQ68_00985T0 [Komagataella phaffii GS115]CAY68986.1 Putative protein of unknown function [Komagataella phaffii GS115]CCA38616.1 Phytosphingosine metabolism [Komagataella phaffii CBS 7435]